MGKIMFIDLIRDLTLITWLFIGLMVTVAVIDFRSYSQNSHKDFKSIIVSLGVLGTFVGICIGLYQFDTSDIKASVPLLLDGLKIAFITSIVGMGLSIFLSFIQKFGQNIEMKDDFQVLVSINSKLNALNSIDTHIQNLSGDISNVKDEMRNNQTMLFEFLEQSLNKINQSLDEAIDKLAEGATEEIIQALERVIADFNSNLTEQFGDNFKQLNESVKNMIVWQENYKESIQQIEKSFNKVILTLTITDEKLKNMTSSYQQIDKTHQDLNRIITTNDNQIKNLELHLKEMSAIGEKAKLMVDSVDNFSDKIKGSLTTQSATLTQLIQDSERLKKEIEKQLPASLGELNKSLTSLTHKFRDDYNSFLEHIGKIMEISNRV